MKSLPKNIEKFFYFFPIFQIGLICLGLFDLMNNPTWSMLILLILFIYMLPPICWRFIKWSFGDIPTISYVGKNSPTGNLWLISYKLQYLFNSFPFFENILKFFPELYSSWLRLWGSKIGKKINWAPESNLVDRTHLILGDRLLIGNKTYITSHVIKKKDNKYLLFFKPVEVQSDSVISFSCTLGPGLFLPEKSFVKAFSVEYQSEYKDKAVIRQESFSG
jgi:acetyltransferase-like isoleucine patch superfamily enzyme